MDLRVIERMRRKMSASGELGVIDFAPGKGGRQIRPRACRAAVGAAVLLVACLAMPVAVVAQAPPDEGYAGAAIGDESEAIGLRLGLLCFVGLALAGGAYTQYQAVGAARRGRNGVRRPEAAPARPGARSGGSPVSAGGQRGHDRALSPVPPAEPAARPSVPLQAASPVAAVPTAAEERCARAIAAAHRYDRRTTLAAFRSALSCDPDAKPSALPGFWEMPSGGHADLARAYLERGQTLDARSVLTVATMLFPHNRELEMLVREAAMDRRSSRSA
jgi:hypothetical protein